MRRQQAQSHPPATDDVVTPPAPPSVVPEVSVGSAADDPELAAYNARLAELEAKGPKTWRHREEVVVRRPQ
jgi:hypothetical protein